MIIGVRVLFFFFFFKQKTAYEIMPSLVGSEMCIRDRVHTRVRAEHHFGDRLPIEESVSNPAQSDFSGPTSWPSGQCARKSHHMQIGEVRGSKSGEWTPSSA